MPFKLHTQHLDLASGMHVVELRNERGHQHLLQFSLLHDSCQACGAVHPKDNIGELDIAGAIAQAIAELNYSELNMLAHAHRYGLTVK